MASHQSLRGNAVLHFIKILSSIFLLSLSMIISIKSNKFFLTFSPGTWTSSSVETGTSPQSREKFPWMPPPSTLTATTCPCSDRRSSWADREWGDCYWTAVRLLVGRNTSELVKQWSMAQIKNLLVSFSIGGGLLGEFYTENLFLKFQFHSWSELHWIFSLHVW